jgi:putative MATE family efflux protein
MTISNKTFLQSVMKLVIPLALQNLINVGVQAAGVIMLGGVSETVLSGASLAGQISYILNLTLFGLTSGAAVLTAQYWGKGDIHAIEKILGITLRISVTISVSVALITFCFPELLMHIFSSDQAVIYEGAKYLRIVCFSYILSSISMVYLNVMRSIERVLISTIVYSISLCFDIFAGATLIYGLFGLPAFGIRGAAISTTFARLVEVIIVIIYNKKYNKVTHFKLKYLLIKDKLLLKDFLHYSLPVLFNELLWGAGMAVNAGILGHLGSAEAAASSVVQVTRQLSMTVSFGISTAAAITIGKTIGECNRGMAKEYGRKFIWLSLASGVISALIVLLIRPAAISIMNLSYDAKQYLSFMMLIMAYYVIIQSFTCTMIVGVFRSGGDTRVGLCIDVLTMWLGSILFGFLAAFVFKFSLHLVYVILMIDEVLKIPLVIWRYRTYKWLKSVTR